VCGLVHVFLQAQCLRGLCIKQEAVQQLQARAHTNTHIHCILAQQHTHTHTHHAGRAQGAESSVVLPTHLPHLLPLPMSLTCTHTHTHTRARSLTHTHTYTHTHTRARTHTHTLTLTHTLIMLNVCRVLSGAAFPPPQSPAPFSRTPTVAKTQSTKRCAKLVVFVGL